jgi:N6-L-threonylcarbamoyladenine synthase
MNALKKTQAVLAFDTSNYTTSIALMDLSGNLLDHQRQLLSVKDGERGLRQSDALFQHVRELPALMEKLTPLLGQVELAAVGYSDRPRRVEGSYMPVFLAGESLARSLAASHGIPCFPFSHQEGHVAAGLWSLGLAAAAPFYALHLSGGTTELLKVTPVADTDGKGFAEEIIGATSDISLGQLIDRTGVALGLGFPAGPALEVLAEKCQEKPFEIPFSISETNPSPPGRSLFNLSLSGPETFLLKKLPGSTATLSIRPEQDRTTVTEADGRAAAVVSALSAAAAESPERMALSLFHFSGRLLGRLVKKACKREPLAMVLTVGGVAANAIVRRVMEQELAGLPVTVHHALPQYCGDNAVGTAFLTLKALREP